jgi:hypothetical protein
MALVGVGRRCPRRVLAPYAFRVDVVFLLLIASGLDGPSFFFFFFSCVSLPSFSFSSLFEPLIRTYDFRNLKNGEDSEQMGVQCIMVDGDMSTAGRGHLPFYFVIYFHVNTIYA